MTFGDFTQWVVCYHVDTRNALFISGFTLGTFLFSMKSVIIKTLKEEIYDKVEYHEDIDSLKSHKYEIAYYGSLTSFSNLLFHAIALSFASAISQFTLGFIEHWFTSILCLLIAVASWVVLGFALFQVRAKWNDVFTHAEVVAEKASQKRRSKREKRSKKKSEGSKVVENDNNDAND